MVELLTSVGFSAQHINLMLLCAVFAALGSLTHVLVSYWGTLARIPSKRPTLLPWPQGLQRLAFFATRTLIGAFLGLLLGLLLTGALVEGVGVVARVLVIAAGLGYSAPKLLEKDADLIAQVVGTALKHLVAPASSPPSNNPGEIPPVA